MKAAKQIRIVVIEDNEFFNQLLTMQLKNYIDTLAEDKGFSLEINSYTNPFDALRNMHDNTDIVFLDYYLGDSVTGGDIMKKIKQQCPECKIIILSQVRSTKTSLVTLLEGASEFIFKDRYAISKSCYIAEEIIQNRLRAASA